MPDGLREFYDSVIKDGKLTQDDMGTYDHFNSFMSDSTNAKSFYDGVTRDGKLNQNDLGTWEHFNKYVQDRVGVSDPAVTQEPDEKGWLDKTKDFLIGVSSGAKAGGGMGVAPIKTSISPEEEAKQGTNFDTEAMQSQLGEFEQQVQSDIDIAAPQMANDGLMSMEQGNKPGAVPGIPEFDGKIPTNTPYNLSPEEAEKESHDLNKSFQAIQNAKDFVTQIEGVQNAHQLQGSNGAKQAWEGFSKSGLAKDFWTMGLSELDRSFDMLAIADKMREGGEVSEGEEMAMGVYGMLQDALTKNDASVAHMVGQGVKDMIPYMASFAATGGVGTAARGGVSTLLNTSKVGLKKLIKDRAYKSIGKEVGKRTLAYGAGAAAQTPLMPMMYTEFAKKATGGHVPFGDWSVNAAQPKGEALRNAFATTYAEVFSERLGEAVFKPMRGMLFKAFNKTKKAVSPGSKNFMQKFQDAAAWDGVVDEYFEELSNAYISNALVSDTEQKPWLEVFDLKEQVVTFLTVSVMGGGMYAANTGNKIYDNVTLDNQYLGGLSKNQRTKVKSIVSNPEDKSIADVSDELVTFIEGQPSMTPEQSMNVLGYAGKKLANTMSGEQVAQDENEVIGTKVAKDIDGRVAQITHNEGGRVGIVTNEQGDMFFVKDGDPILDEDSGKYFTSNDQPIVVMGMDGRKTMMAAKDIETAEWKSPEEVHEELTKRAGASMAEADQTRKEADKEVLIEPGQTFLTPEGKPASVEMDLGEGYWGVTMDGNAETMSEDQITEMINAQVDAEGAINKEKTEQQAKENQPGPVKTDKEGRRSIKVAKGNKELELELTPQEDGSTLVGETYNTAKEADPIAKLLNDRYENSEFTVVKLTDPTDPWAETTLRIVAKPKANEKTGPSEPGTSVPEVPATAETVQEGSNVATKRDVGVQQPTEKAGEVVSELGEDVKDDLSKVAETSKANAEKQSELKERLKETKKQAEFKEGDKLKTTESPGFGIIEEITETAYIGRVGQYVRAFPKDEAEPYVEETETTNEVTETKVPTLTPEQAERAGLDEREIPNKTTLKTESDKSNVEQIKEIFPLKADRTTRNGSIVSTRYETKVSSDGEVTTTKPVGSSLNTKGEVGGASVRTESVPIAEFDKALSSISQMDDSSQEMWDEAKGDAESVTIKELREPTKQNTNQSTFLEVKVLWKDGTSSEWSFQVKTNTESKPDQEPQVNDSWRKKFDELKATNDLKGLDNFYGKVRIALNGLAQGRGDATVKFFEELKKEIELYAEELKVNTNPTEAQKEAGNYKKGHVSIQGMDITIENPKGSQRSGTDENGKEWTQKMNNTYGYFKRTKGKDGDQIDVFLGDNLESEKIFVVDQVNPETGEFDEHKVMLGFNDIQSATDAYNSNYESGWKGLGQITEVPLETFKSGLLLLDGTRRQKPFADYKSVKDVKVVDLTKKKKRDNLKGDRLKAYNLEVSTPYDFAMKYFIGGGAINTKALFSLYGTKGKEEDAAVKKKVESERRKRISYVRNDGSTINGIAHALWEDHRQDLPNAETDQYREAIEQIVNSFNHPSTMAKDMLDRYNQIAEDEEVRNNNFGYNDEEVEARIKWEREQDSEIDEIVFNILEENDKLGLSLSDNDLVNLFELSPEEFKKLKQLENEQARTSEEVEGNNLPGSEDKGQESSESSTENAKEPSKQERIAEQQAKVKDLTNQLTKAENKHSKLKTKLENDPEHGGKGQADIFGGVAASDMLDLDFDNKASKELVNAAKKEVDALRKQVGEETIKLNDLQNVSENQGDLFVGDMFNTEEKPQPETKPEQEKYGPRDGWETNLIKLREYALALFGKEGVSEARKGNGALVWNNVSNIKAFIDGHLRSGGRFYKNITPDEFTVLEVTASFKSQFRRQYFEEFGIADKAEEIKEGLYAKGLLLKNGGITPKGRELRDEIKKDNDQASFVSYNKDSYTKLFNKFWGGPSVAQTPEPVKSKPRTPDEIRAESASRVEAMLTDLMTVNKLRGNRMLDAIKSVLRQKDALTNNSRIVFHNWIKEHKSLVEGAVNQKGFVGVNHDLNMIFEDEDGNRKYKKGNILISHPVSIIPTKHGVTTPLGSLRGLYLDGRLEFLTDAEIKKLKAEEEPETKEEATKEVFEYKMFRERYEAGAFPKNGFIEGRQIDGTHVMVKFDRRIPISEARENKMYLLSDIEAIKGKEFVDKDGHYQTITLDWRNDMGADVTTVDKNGKKSVQVLWLGANDVLQNIEDGYWTEKPKEDVKAEGPQFAAEALEENKYGSDNKIVTNDRYEELKRKMKDKLNNMNVGFDPEMFAMGAEMAAFHIESGARKFADFTKRMVNDLGEAIKPYLKSYYKGARNMPGMEDYSKEMDSDTYVDDYNYDNSQSQPIEEAPKPDVYSIEYTLTEPIQEKEHTKTGDTFYLVKMTEKLDDWQGLKRIAYNNKGGYSRFAKGFLFSKGEDPKENARKFRHDVELKFGNVKEEPTTQPTEQPKQVHPKDYTRSEYIKDAVFWFDVLKNWPVHITRFGQVMQDVITQSGGRNSFALAARPNKKGVEDLAGQIWDNRDKLDVKKEETQFAGEFIEQEPKAPPPTRTGELIRPAPQIAPEVEEDKKLGVSESGHPIYLRPDGSRYYDHGGSGAFIFETPRELDESFDKVFPVEELYKKGHYDWLTTEELKDLKGKATKDLTNDDKSRNFDKRENLIQAIKFKIESDERISNTAALRKMADEAGMEVGKDYQSFKELYDIAGTALNQYILDHGEEYNPEGKSAEEAVLAVTKLTNRQSLLPTETQRSAEQVELQQYSTPPGFAYLANWVAQVNKDDTVLEPSAGEGNIAVYAVNTGAKVIANEIDKKRSLLLEQLGVDKVLNDDAKHLHAISALSGTPVTTVVMNPPFSRDMALGNKQDLHAAEKHIDSMLKKLEPEGRLVAIVGRGMSFDSPTHKAWWNKVKAKYRVHANILVNGQAYKAKGTSFDNRILVIDKVGETFPSEFIVTGEAQSYQELVGLLKQVPNKPKIKSNGNINRPGEKKTGQDGNSGTRTVSGQSNVGGARPSATTNTVRGTGPTRQDPGPTPNDGQGNTDLFGDSTEGTNDGTKTPDNSTGDSRLPSSRSSVPRTVKGKGISITQTKKKGSNSKSLGYDNYIPEIVGENTKSHPSQLVESTAMSSVSLPKVTHTPIIDKKIIESGALSDAQFEDIVLAGNSHKQILPNGDRRGFFLGAGTGYGKGRTIAAIIMDNWNRGNKKAVWLSANDKSHYDSKDYWEAVGGDPKQTFQHKNSKTPIKRDEGVLLLTYGTMKSGFDRRANYSENEDFFDRRKKHENRLQQLAHWLGKDYNGVIVFDESHKMANAKAVRGARGTTKASLTALAGIELQRMLPKARIVYSSATGATEVSNLAYAQRLGLWGDGTPFDNSDRFIEAISSSGVAGMEIISKDLKAMGLYTAKSLGFDGVKYQTLEHKLLPEQTDLYNQVADAWQLVLNNIQDAIEESEPDSQSKSSAMSRFWGAHQRFFSQIILTMQMPSVLADVQKELDAGNATVMQLVNTNEAATKRALAEARSESEDGQIDFDLLDLSPKGSLLEYVRQGYPTAMFESVIDEEGNELRVKVRDAEGNVVHDPDLVRKRDNLINKLDETLTLPESPLDIIMNTFGSENIAEITGRTTRVVRKLNDDNDLVKVEEKRTTSNILQDKNDFMDDKKQILIFSKAGGTGASFHSDLTKKNQRHRVHYLLQAGWRADDAVQGFGRTHRSNQKTAPTFKLVTTDLKSQRRFLSSIARRLDQLGALTKGQRQTGGQGILDGEEFNLEGIYASQTLFEFYQDVEAGRVPGVDLSTLEDQMALKIYVEDADGNMSYNESVIHNTTMFLNRIMSLRVDLMDSVFDGFMSRLSENIRNAKESGNYDEGIQVVNAESTKVIDERVIYTDEKTGGETVITTLELEHKRKKATWDQINAKAVTFGSKFKGFYTNKKSGKIYLISEQPIVNADGSRTSKIRRVSTVSDTFIDNADFRNKYDKHTSEEAKALWEEDFKNSPDTYTTTDNIVKGLILPIWNRLPEKINVRRYIDDEGNAHLGRFFNKRDIESIITTFGVASNKDYTPKQLKEVLTADGTVKLANGFVLEKGKYQGLAIAKILNANSYSDRQRLERAGALFAVKSTMSMQGEFYLPLSNAEEGLEKIIELYNAPAISVEDKEGNHVAASNTKGKKTSNSNNIRASLSEPTGVANSTTPYVEAPKVPETAAELFNDTYLDKFYSWENEAKRQAQALADELGTEVRIVKTEAELPKSVRQASTEAGFEGKARGLYNPATKKVYIILSNNENTNQVRNTILHETVGHKGLRLAFGRKYNRLLENIYNQMTPEEIQKLSKQYGTNDIYVIADEFLAYKAGNSTRPGFIKKAIAQIKEWIRNIVSLKYSDNDINYLFELSRKALRNEPPPPPLKKTKRGPGYVAFGNEDKFNADGDYTGDYVGEMFGEVKPLLAGEKGTTNLQQARNVAIAEQMEKSGKDNKTIWMATGWERGKDGKWRYELPDFKINTKAKDRLLNSDKYTKGKHHLQHSNDLVGFIGPKAEALKAYPTLKGVMVTIEIAPKYTSEKGSYTPFVDRSSEGLTDLYPEIEIYANTIEKAESVLLHEVQHAIQREEGFAVGGNYKDIDVSAYKNVMESTLKSKITSLEKLLPKFNKGEEWIDEQHTLISEKIDRIEDGLLELKNNNLTYEAYKHLAGETEARNVQSRAKFAGDYLKQTPPSETEDVERDQQIVSYGGGQQFAGNYLNEENNEQQREATIRGRNSNNGKQPVNGEITSRNRNQEKEGQSKKAEEVTGIRASLPTEKDQGIWRGKRFWSGIVSLLDGKIEEVHPYKRAEAADFHHSFYVSRAAQERMTNGESAFFFIDDDGSVSAWTEEIPDKIITKIENQIETTEEGIRASLPEPSDLTEPTIPIKDVYDILEDNWFGNKDWEKLKASIQAKNFQERIKQSFKKNPVPGAKDWKDVDKAIHLFLDTFESEEDVAKYWPKLDKEQRRLITLSQNLTPEMKRLAWEIRKEYDVLGSMALDEGAIFNVLDNYVARSWDLGKDQNPTEFWRKFGTTTKHAKKRTLGTILEGWAMEDKDGNNLGMQLAVEGATNNLSILKSEIHTVIENKKLIKQGLATEDENGKALFSTKPLHGYEKVEHPGFRTWEKAKYLDGKMRKTQTLDRDTFISEKGVVYKRKDIYAPAPIAKKLNNVLSESSLKGPVLDEITRLNAALKRTVLSWSFFHHMAFGRSYVYASALKNPKDINPRAAYKEGMEHIENMSPEVELLVRNGLTLGRVQDWDELFLQQKGKIGKWLDKHNVGNVARDKVRNLHEEHTNFLFNTMGAGMKVKTAILEMNHLRHKHPTMDENTIAKMAASSTNKDFGGLHLERMGRSKTRQHWLRLLLLAPDWTESNVLTMVSAFGYDYSKPKGERKLSKEEHALYRRFWARAISRIAFASVAMNLLLAMIDGGDDDDYWETVQRRYKDAFQNPERLNWLAADVTPLYRMVQGKDIDPQERKYFSMAGHFQDPYKWVVQAIKGSWTSPIKNKGSIFVNTIFSLGSGTTWNGRRYADLAEVLGYDDKGVYSTSKKNPDWKEGDPYEDKYIYKVGDPKGGRKKGELTKWASPGESGGVKSSAMIPFAIAKARDWMPIPLQNLTGALMGEIDAFDAMSHGVGMHMSRNFIKEENIQDQYDKIKKEATIFTRKVSTAKKDRQTDDYMVLIESDDYQKSVLVTRYNGIIKDLKERRTEALNRSDNKVAEDIKLQMEAIMTEIVEQYNKEAE